jgi:MFS family permease
MDTMGAVAGPGLAYLLLQAYTDDYRRVFWLSMIPGIIAVLIIIWCIKEKKNPSADKQKPPRLSLRDFDWRVKFFILIAALFALGNSSDAFLILRAQQLGISAVMIPVVYLSFNLIYSLCGIPAGIAADRFGMKRIILAGFILFAALYYGFAVVTTASGVWALFALYGIFMGLTEGIQKAYLATIIPSAMKATDFGVFATAVGLAQLPASLIAGLLWDRLSPSATFYFGAATASLAAMLFAALIAGSGKIICKD